MNFFISLARLQIIAFIILSSYTAGFGQQNPLAAWPLNGTIEDISGNGYHGYGYTGTFNSIDVREGSHSFEFGGNDTIQLCDKDDAFMNHAFSVRSISMWVKPTSQVGIQNLYEEGGSGNGMIMRLNGGGIEVAIRSGNEERSLSLSYPSDGAWHHLTLVFDNGDIHLYIDGVKAGSKTTDFPQVTLHANEGGLGGVLGGSDSFGSTTGNFYTGLMDDVRLYDRALTPQEILEISGGNLGSRQLYSIASGNWEDPAIWVDSIGGVTVNRAPTKLDSVYVFGHEIVIDSWASCSFLLIKNKLSEASVNVINGELKVYGEIKIEKENGQNGNATFNVQGQGSVTVLEKEVQ